MMETVFNLILVFGLFIGVLVEKSDSKELDSEDDDDTLLNLFIDEEIQGKNERYARHVQAITENALDHLINEIRYEYFKNNYYANSPLRKYIHRFNEEMERRKRNELIKNKHNNKKKTPIKKKKKWVKKNKKTPNNKRKKCNGKLSDKTKKPTG